MLFSCDGKTYDTDQMISLDGDLGHAVGIYITPDYRCVFAAYMYDSGIKVRAVDLDELRGMAQELDQSELIKALNVAISATSA